MTPEQQVKEIIILLSPEDVSTQTDALFVVQTVFAKLRAERDAKDKQIALLEAQLQARSDEKQEVVNEKLASEERLKKEKGDLVKQYGLDKKSEKPGVGGGRTL